MPQTKICRLTPGLATSMQWPYAVHTCKAILTLGRFRTLGVGRNRGDRRALGPLRKRDNDLAVDGPRS